MCASFLLLITFVLQFSFIESQGFCRGSSFWCIKGHCCKGGRCCSYYYELWWFWAIWAGVVLLSCCCLFQRRRRQHGPHRHSRHRPSPRATGARQTFIQAVDATFPTLFDSRLPTYDEVKQRPPNPPPYDRLTDTCLPETSIPALLPPSYDKLNVTCLQDAGSSHLTEPPVHRQFDHSDGTHLPASSTDSETASLTQPAPPWSAAVPSDSVSISLIAYEERQTPPCTDPPPPYSSKTSII